MGHRLVFSTLADGVRANGEGVLVVWGARACFTLNSHVANVRANGEGVGRVCLLLFVCWLSVAVG